MTAIVRNEDDYARIRSHIHRLMGLRPGCLSQIVESPDEDLDTRRAAGHLLAFLGDPRLNTFAPVMMDLPGDRNIRVAKYPLTNQEFFQFLRYTGNDERPSAWSYGLFPEAHANHPVHGITPAQASAYAWWLQEMTGRAFEVMTKNIFDLAVSTDGHRFPWGNEPSPQAANTSDLDFLGTTPVGSFPEGTSWCGAMDLIGNVAIHVRHRNAWAIRGLDCCQSQETHRPPTSLVGMRLMERC